MNKRCSKWVHYLPGNEKEPLATSLVPYLEDASLILFCATARDQLSSANFSQCQAQISFWENRDRDRSLALW